MILFQIIQKLNFISTIIDHISETNKFMIFYQLPNFFLGHKLFLESSAIYLFNRSWRITETPNTTNFFLIVFKFIQQSNMVILSCLFKKKQKLNLRKKKVSLLLKREVCRCFCLENANFSNKLDFFSSNSNIDFIARQLRMTISDFCISLEMIKKNFWLCLKLWICASFC